MRLLACAAFLVLSLGFASTLPADTGTASAGASVALGDSTKAKRVDDPPSLAVAGIQEDGLAGSCALRAANQGAPRKGVKGTFDAILIDANTGTTLADLGKRKGKTNKEGVLTVDYPVPRMADFAVLAAMVVDLDVGGGKKVTEIEFSCELVDETP